MKRRIKEPKEMKTPAKTTKADEKPPLILIQNGEELRLRPITSLKLDGVDQKSLDTIIKILENDGAENFGDLEEYGRGDLVRFLGVQAFNILQKEFSSMGLPLIQSMSIYELDLSAEAKVALGYAKITRVRDLIKEDEHSLRVIGLEKRVIEDIKGAMAMMGLSLKYDG